LFKINSIYSEQELFSDIDDTEEIILKQFCKWQRKTFLNIDTRSQCYESFNSWTI